jgi:hypothetical protein
MISTVTTSTVSTVTLTAIAGSLAFIGMALLFALLIQKEIAAAAPEGRLRQLAQTLNIGIVPLLIAFGLLVVIQLIELLQ